MKDLDDDKAFYSHEVHKETPHFSAGSFISLSFLLCTFTFGFKLFFVLSTPRALCTPLGMVICEYKKYLILA